MPLDPRIPLGIQAPQGPNPLEIMQTVAQLQGIREQTEARRLAAEEARQRGRDAAEKRAREAREDQDLATLFATTPKPTLQHFTRIIGAERAVKLAEGIQTLGKLDAQQVTDARADAGRLVNGLLALSPTMQTAVWPRVRQAAIRGGLGDETSIPETPTPEYLKAVQAWAGEKPPGLQKVTKYDPATGQTVETFVTPTEGAEFVQPPPKTTAARALQAKEVLIDGQRAFANYDPDAGTYERGGQDVTARVRPIPPQGADPILHELRQMQLDAAKQAAASGGNWTPKQVVTFNQISSQYQRSPLVAAADRTIVLKQAIKDAKADPKNATHQLNLAYAYVQALDTYQSAVREGELQNLGLLGTRLQQLGTTVDRLVSSGAFIPPAVATQIATSAETLATTIEQGRRQKQREFGSRAKVSGIGEMWDQFIAGADAPPAGAAGDVRDGGGGGGGGGAGTGGLTYQDYLKAKGK